MTLSAGSRLGPYEITAEIGAGGMGIVYRARDRKLDRDVALKVLPDLFTRDPERLARFEREAKVLASLNHPNIAAIYGLEESGEVRAIVMELVEGPTLAERLGDVGRVLSDPPVKPGPKGPGLRTEGSPAEAGRHAQRGRGLPIEEVLPIARQIADALEAAHEHGVMHRDLKPANIKVRPDGTVKVLDFGLAKALDPVARGDPYYVAQGFSPADANSPTITNPAAMTGAGVILGTAAYMSPEQARGKATDKRTDIWAFGCVLYEMLTGTRVFDGEDVTDTLAAVVRADPDWRKLPAETPPATRRLLRRCLEKDRKERAPDIGMARPEIKEALAAPDVEITRAVEASRGSQRERLAWIAVALALAVGVVALAVPYFRTPAAAPETRLEITTPATTDPISFAISPDGRRLAFVASGDGQPRLWLRPIDAVTVQPLPGTEGAAYPFWSPDSRSVAFFAGGKLKRIDIGGGPPQTLANASLGRGGTWSPDGVILFNVTAGSGLFRVPASGGEAVAVTKPAPGQAFHLFPNFLPGGRQFLFGVVGTPDTGGIYLGSLDSTETKRLTGADTAGAYIAPDWLLFVRQGTLIARHFDAGRGELTGDPLTVADPVGFDPTNGAGAFSVSAAGLVTYRAAGAVATQLTWFDRSGKALSTMGARDENGLLGPRLSPDGSHVAVYRTAQQNMDVWLLDVAHATRFTFDASQDLYPLWSPDGRRIVFG